MTAPTGPYLVRRAFTAGDTRLPAGTIVDVTGWRNAFQLVDRGWLVPVPKDRLEDAPAPRARKATKKAAPKKIEPKTED